MIDALIIEARQHGVYFTPDPSNPGSVQVRVLRSGSERGHQLADQLRLRRDEVIAFLEPRRPPWPVVDDGLPPAVRMTADEEISLDRMLFEAEWHLAVSALVTARDEAVYRLDRLLDAKVSALADQFETRYRRIVRRSLAERVAHR